MPDRQSLLLRGVLDLCVMALMDDEPLYGYDVVPRLARFGLTVAPGSVYPLLARLERAGLTEASTHPSEIGPPRRWWRLTDAGAHALADGRSSWRELVGAVDRALQTSQNFQPTSSPSKERS